MPLWRFRPVARPEDPRWQDHPIWDEVVVRADSSALARTLAARLEWDPEEPPSGNESLTFRSGFDDEKLYWVAELDPEAAAAFGGEAGPPGVIHAVPAPSAETEQ